MAMIFTSCQSSSRNQLNNKKLVFNKENFSIQELNYNGKLIKVRAYEKIVYVENPIDTTYQQMNIYVPLEYYEGKTIHGYTKESAPIFYPNGVGGYMPAKPISFIPHQRRFRRPELNAGNKDTNKTKQKEQVNRMNQRPNTIAEAILRGYIVASAGARGRTSNIGKAPAGIVDLKAGIRYLKYNDSLIPGDANKIISNGTSAGGAISTLLGATGDHSDYESYLSEIGAAPASDAIFAVSAYCPITNLDHADMAYEWQFNGINTYHSRFPSGNSENKDSKLTDDQIKISSELKNLFPAYLNSLMLHNQEGKLLNLDTNGKGNFNEYVASFVIASAQSELDKGNDLSSFGFLTIENNTVKKIDLNAYFMYMKRQKTPPAFDAIGLSSPENMLFGDSITEKKHFTDFAFNYTKAENVKMANESIIRMMNPMNYINQVNTNTSAYWRIRHGSIDKDTSLAIPVILATFLENKGYKVDFKLPWEKPHSGDYDLQELFQWIDDICKI